ncbi:MAG TPA: ABC transporter permease subunit, partial [Candidatus Limnocylindrales bacterium]|nr:ABC transporter permease subunit [Candidatus Limnocylindrales bacterium]
SMLAGSLVLAIMILPTIITISEDSIRSIPKSYKEASLAIGATHWQTIKNIILPSARTGIIAGAILGMARALGETMAVIMVLGNAPIIPQSILDPVRALTATIGLEMAYAHGPHRQALFAVGIVLFVVIMSLVLITNIIRKEIRH